MFNEKFFPFFEMERIQESPQIFNNTGIDCYLPQ